MKILIREIDLHYSLSRCWKRLDARLASDLNNNKNLDLVGEGAKNNTPSEKEAREQDKIFWVGRLSHGLG